MTDGLTTYRQIGLADLIACADVLDEADNELSARRGIPPGPRNPEALLRLFTHLLEHYPDRGWVAEQDGRIVGFGSAVEYGDFVYLAFLFVLPGLQEAGIGRELLERAMHDSEYRGVSIASYQPISAALYARYGMVPRVPVYMLSGKPNRDLTPLPPGLRVGSVAVEAVAPIDMSLCGFERPQDHRFWEEFGRRRYGLYRGNDLVGYGYMQQTGRLGPFVVLHRQHLLPFVGALLANAPDVEAWLVNVPGPASDVFQALLHSGMRLEGPPGIYCATDLRVDHSRYLPASYALP